MKSSKVKVSAASTLIAILGMIGSGCGAQVKAAPQNTQQALNEVDALERLRFAKASADVDAIELALRIEGSKTIAPTGTDTIEAETPDVVTLQVGKDGKLEAAPAVGMDIRGEGQCLDSACRTAQVALKVNESGFSAADLRLEITTTRMATCQVKQTASTADDLSRALSESLKGKLILSLVEKSDRTAKFLAITKAGEEAVRPFLRANLEPESVAQLDLIKKDSAGNLSRSTIQEVVVGSATVVKSPFALSATLKYKNQPSATVTCKF